MRPILRTAALVAALVGSVGIGTSPAVAQEAAVFHGIAYIDCFGCGSSDGTADICVTIQYPSNEVCDEGFNAHATYAVEEPEGLTCLVTGTAKGKVTGAVNVDFNWTRVGATAVISTTGDINGSGTAAFKVTSPVGPPCPGPVTAQFAGSVAGP